MGKKDIPETEQEGALAEVSIEKWNDHQRRLVPMENKVIEGANRSTQAAGIRAAGAVNADVAQAMVAPLNPNSGKSTSSTPALSMAKKSAKAQVGAAQTVEDQRASALSNVVNMGEGKSATATAGFETAAANATNSAITGAQINQANRQAIGGAVGSAAGAAVFAATRKTPDGNLSDFGTAEGQAAAINGASLGKGGYSYNKSNGNFTWNS